MIKKVDILGIQLDNYTVREAIMCVERYLMSLTRLRAYRYRC